MKIKKIKIRRRDFYISVIGIILGGLFIWECSSRFLYYQVFGKYPFAIMGPFPRKKTEEIRADDIKEPASGRWRKEGKTGRSNNLTDEQKQTIRKLQSIGYVSGSQKAPDEKNVTIYDMKRAYKGLNLVVSGHGPEAILMDMDGREIHKWTCDISLVWPDHKIDPWLDESKKQHTFWRRVHLMENGDLLAIFSGVGLIKLDKNSKLLWSSYNGAHHDLSVTQEGNIYVLTRKAHINEKYNPRDPILEDYICLLDSEGQELQKVSVLEILENSHVIPILRRLIPKGDLLHSNTIEYIEKRQFAKKTPFRPGTLLLSIHRLNLVCGVDFEKKSVYWAESDFWFRQHQPTLLTNGNILVFDNLGLKGSSAVIEFDPYLREIKWIYRGDKDNPFLSRSCGSCQYLPNGNILITESDPGRAFEVTSDKEIVWKYVNPYRAGEENELIATLFEVVRLNPDFPIDWLP